MKSEPEDGEIILFMRKEGESEEEWDDTQLIKAYDKAISKAKRQILKKLQVELELTNEEVQEICSDTSSSKKKKTNKKKKNSKKKSRWEVGTSCRAVFSEDGEEYEAVVIKNIDENWCIVRFVGYDNEEEVLQKELMPSLGKHIVRLQIESANSYNATLEESAMETEGQETEEQDKAPTSQPSNGAPPREGEAQKPSVSDPRFLFSPWRPPIYHRAPPPPPPPPPVFSSSHNGFVNPMANAHVPHLPIGNDGLDAVLLSWYMCGYYTGYYQREVKEKHNRLK